MKTIAIITISHEVAIFYSEILKSIYGSELKGVIYSLERTGIEDIGNHDLYLVATTSSDIYSYVISNIVDESKIVIAQLTFLKKDIEMLRSLKVTSALFINLSENMARESISDLHRLGVNHITFTPYYPGAKNTNERIAVTSGESRYAPSGIERLIDIGNRYLSANTVTEIALKLNLKSELTSSEYKKYVKKLAEQDYSITALRDETLSIENKFEVLVDNVSFGLIGTDAKRRVIIFNPLAQKYTGYDKNRVMYADITKCMNEFSKINFDDSESNYLINFLNEQYSVAVTPIKLGGELVGRYIMLQKFSELEESQVHIRKQLMRRSSAAKYTFDDIICECERMCIAKNIAKRMAQTDLSVLLYGESGTGKELFAHSIHNASKRADKPFVAINCAAIPDNLLESELFGYVEGAFTGAVKGGKIGLFEQVHKGTIFLDEIETMSSNMQIKLLRVLEEKEIMRIGDVKTVSIDVRVICATNEDIRQLVREGSFRKDLYYRLNTLPIEIPPLRERKGDILLLVDEIKKLIGADFVLSEECEQLFLSYKWEGNVRELRNILEYLKFMELDIVNTSDLPIEFLRDCAEHTVEPTVSERQRHVLKAVYESRGGVGRNYIKKVLGQRGINFTEGEIRSTLKDLTERGLVVSGSGRSGSRINDEMKNKIRKILG